MTWNYRVIRKVNKLGEYFGIHEVFYLEDGENDAVTQDSIAPYGETLGELKESYELMKEAFDAPVMDYDDFGG